MLIWVITQMIACDNEGNCPYEWFHLTCVGLKQPTPEKRHCSICSENMTKGNTGTRREGKSKTAFHFRISVCIVLS